MESALAHFPRIIISDAAIAPICHGAQLAVPGILQMDDGVRKGDKVAVFTQKGEAVMLGTASKSTVQVMGSNKGIAVKTERVLMETDVYPRFKK
jgi:H/ACA ribonucleoprotein complex subunit 4